MCVVLAFLTVDTLDAMRAGGSHVPPYSVINHQIDYAFNAARKVDVPVNLFGAACRLAGAMTPSLVNLPFCV